MSLKELCIRKICEQVPRLSLFVCSSPLPWSLTQEIIRKFPLYKWQSINADAKKHENDLDIIEPEFEFVTDITPSFRQSLLLIDNFEIFSSLDCYCAMIEYYKLHNFDILLCKSCFLIFKEILEEKSIKVSYSLNVLHEPFTSYELHNLYQHSSYWCQNSFSEILFELNDRSDCESDLHGRGWVENN